MVGSMSSTGFGIGRDGDRTRRVTGEQSRVARGRRSCSLTLVVLKYIDAVDSGIEEKKDQTWGSMHIVQYCKRESLTVESVRS